MNEINLHHVVVPSKPTAIASGPKTRREPVAGAFKNILQSQVEKKVVFSKHCLKRLEENGITLSTAQVERLNEGVEKARAKGARDSCMVMDDMAFVVSVNNRKVITVVEGSRMKENVFTNIDSAVIL